MNLGMKRSTLLAAALAAGFALTGAAWAQSGSEVVQGDVQQSQSQSKERDRAAAKHHHGAKQGVRGLDALAETLALRPDQQEVWQEFRQSFQREGRTGQEREKRAEAPLTAPERAARHEARAEAWLAQARQVRTATEALYEKLDAEQRQRLDEHSSRGLRKDMRGGPQRKRGAEPAA